MDAHGLNGPLPILRTKKSLNERVTGQILTASVSDPGAIKDMQADTKQTGNELVSVAASGGEYIFMSRKG
ncbi:MAG: sulfurtransferase TusA family protein [Sulfuriferula sp.]